MLLDVGALDPKDDRPLSRKTFDAQKYAKTLEEISTLVSFKEGREALGATRHELKALIDGGVLNPASHVAALRLVWRLPDAIDLLAELKSLAVTLEGTVEGWETISMAKNRSGLKTDQIIAAIRGGHVRLGRQPDRANYSDLLVCKFEMDEFVRQAAPEPGPILISASKFCREICLLDTQNYYALFAAGHPPAVRMKTLKPAPCKSASHQTTWVPFTRDS